MRRMRRSQESRACGGGLHPPFLLHSPRDPSGDASCPKRAEGATGRWNHLFLVSEVDVCWVSLVSPSSSWNLKASQVLLHSIHSGNG